MPDNQENDPAGRLRRAEEIIETLRNSQVDAVVGTDDVSLLRLKQVEDKLAEQAKIAGDRLKEIESIYQNVPVGMCVLDRDLRFVRVNRRLAEINGIPAEEHLGRTVREVLPGLADLVESDLREVIETGKPRLNYELRGETQAQPGVVRHWLEHWLPLHDDQGIIVGINMVIEEITERKQFEEKLQQLNATLERRVAERTKLAEQRAERLREMALEMSRIEERERRRLALLLHDGLQQLLVAAKFKTGLIRSRLADQDWAKTPLDQLDQIMEQSIEASRSLSHDLSPPILHDRGLEPALSWLAREMHRNQGLTVDFHSDGEMPEMSDSLKVFLFQGVRELLLNVVKHAGVEQAELFLSSNQNQICIDVIDQGRGFDLAQVDSMGTAGLGLLNFREQLNLLNGRMMVDSKPGKGCRISIRVRCDASPEETVDSEYTQEEMDEIFTGSDGSPRRAPTRAPSRQTTKVLVVDDHQTMRSGLVSMLDEEPDIEIIGEASNGLEAIAFVRKRQPDVIVMDISMPKMDGIKATRLIHYEFPNIRILGLSVYEQDEYISSMKDAGAATLLSKGGPPELLFKAIRTQ